MQAEQQLGSGTRPEAGQERITVQRPLGTAVRESDAWTDLAVIWGVVDMPPPRDIWPCQNGKDVAVWVATDYRAGIAPGFRLLLRGGAFSIAEVVCAHEHRPGMWLRVLRDEKTGLVGG